MNQIQGPQFIFQVLGSIAQFSGTLRDGVALLLGKNTHRYLNLNQTLQFSIVTERDGDLNHECFHYKY